MSIYIFQFNIFKMDDIGDEGRGLDDLVEMFDMLDKDVVEMLWEESNQNCKY